MVSEKWLVGLLPAISLFLVGSFVGSQFETLWIRFAVGFPAGIAAYFLYRWWGGWIISKEDR